MAATHSTSWQTTPDAESPLARLVKSTAALAGILWKANGTDLFQAIEQCGLGGAELTQKLASAPGHLAALQQVQRTQVSVQLPARLVVEGIEQAVQLLLVPAGPHRVVELCCLATSLPDVAFVQSMAAMLPPSGDSTADWNRLADLVRRWTSVSDFRQLQQQVVDDLRTWSEVDRVTLVDSAEAVPSVKAISGLPQFDPRSAAVQHLVHLAKAEQRSTDLSETTLWILPHSQMVLIWEQLGTTGERVLIPPAQQGVATATIDQLLASAKALQIAHQHPLRRWLSPLWGTGARRVLLVAALLFGVILALTTIPAELVIETTGTLRPEQTRDVFAPTAAIVREIHVAHGDEVKLGTLLLTLHSSRLDQEWEQLEGTRRTAQQQLLNAENLSRQGNATNADPVAAAERATLIEELKVQITSLQEQLALLAQQRAELQLRSPVDGTVLTWNVDELLQGRPVDPTDKLLTVAQLAGDWHLEILVPQRDLPALPNDVPSVKATFQLPGQLTPQKALVTEAAAEMHVDPQRGTVLLMLAQVSPRDVTIAEIRPGTEVSVRLDCGPTTLGYAWFRHAIDQVQGWWTLTFGSPSASNSTIH